MKINIKTPFAIICLVLITCISSAQSNPYDIRFSYQIEKDLAEEIIKPSRAGLLYSLIGNYQESTSYSEIPVSWGVDTMNLNNYSLVRALPHIIEAAQQHQVVIISENHLKPQHRIFASQVITELSNHGFKHLGLETFSSLPQRNTLLDSNLLERGYPLNSPLTGTYTLEPKMGSLVRKAIESEFKLFAYERRQKIKGKDRDEIQADNIIRYINQNPNSKFIIVCGFHHAIESDLPKRGNSLWMAKYLKEKLGIDPLTIYQDNFTEKFIEDEHPILHAILPIAPSVFEDFDGNLVNITDHVDIEVLHPKTTYRNGRPNWLYETDLHQAIKIKIEDHDLNFPVIVSAFPIGELNSVPVDRIELKHKYDQKALVLEPGSFRITIYDGASTIEYFQTVE